MLRGSVMLNPMIERVARALWDNSLLKPYHMHDATPAMSPPESGPDWQRFIPLARSILSTMREPTDDMLTAAAGLTEGEGGPTETWQTMIDAALANG